jgi:thiol-disulfide isomerase/thioredoxin
MPLVVCIAVAIMLVGLLRIRGRRVQLESVMVAGVYLWVPTAVMGLLGSALNSLGLALPFLPHVPLETFWRLELPWWMLSLRAVVAYGWSGALLWILFRHLDTRPAGDKQEDPARLPGHAPWLLAAFWLLAMAAGAVSVAGQYDQLRPVRSGDPAPGFELPVAGKQELVSLASSRGKPVVLDFWATWCPTCIKGMPKVIAFAKAHPDVRVLAVHQGGDPDEVAAFVAEQKWSGITFLVDTTGETSFRYRAETLPKYVVVDPQGRINGVSVGIPAHGWLESRTGR